MSLIYVTPPAIPARSRPKVWIVTAFVVAFLCVGGYWGWVRLKDLAASSADVTGSFFKVELTDLDIVVHQSGELNAVKNADIVCPVEGQSTIVKIVPEGQSVHAGEVVVELDSSDIKKRIQTSTLDVKKSESDFNAAKQQLAIQESKNTADLETAEVELTIARLDFREYTEGKYPADLLAAHREVQMGELGLKDKQEALEHTKTLLAKGFATQEELKKAELEVITAQNALEKAQTAQRVLQDYTHEKDLADKTDKVRQAEKKVQRVKNENQSSMAEKTSDMQGKEQALLVNQQVLDHLNEQLALCTIKAPTDGIILYGASGPGYVYYRRDTPIGPGVKIQEQEGICRLPDTSAMKVVLKVPESTVNKLKADANKKMRATVKIVASGKLVKGWVSNIAVVADSAQRWWDPDARDFPVDITLDEVPVGLKPGASAEVAVYVDQLRGVLAVPPAAIYSAGSDSYVFTKTDRTVTPMKVTLGQMSETLIQVTSGITAGTDVLLLQPGQGHDLLDKHHIVPTPTSQPSMAHDQAALSVAGD